MGPCNDSRPADSVFKSLHTGLQVELCSTGRLGGLARWVAGPPVEVSHSSDLAKADSESRAMILRSLDSDLTVALLPDLWRWRLG